MKVFSWLSIVILVLFCPWSSVRAIDATALTALQQYSGSASTQVYSNSLTLNELYAEFDTVNNQLNSQYNALVKNYQAMNDFLTSFPACGQGSLSGAGDASTAYETCTSTVLPGIMSYLDDSSGTPTPKIFAQLSELADTQSRATRILQLIGSYSNKVFSVSIDSASITPLVNSYAAAANANLANYPVLAKCFGKNAAVPASGLNTCWQNYALKNGTRLSQANYTGAPVACSITCPNNDCCNDVATTYLQGYNAYIQSAESLFNALQPYFPNSNISESSSIFSELSSNTEGSWAIGCMAPSFCTNCGHAAAVGSDAVSNFCEISFNSFSGEELGSYIAQFTDWANTVNTVWGNTATVYQGYSQSLAELTNEINVLINNIVATLKLMNPLVTCCQTEEAVYQHWVMGVDMAISMIAGMVIGIAEFNLMTAAIAEMFGEIAGLHVMLMAMQMILPQAVSGLNSPIATGIATGGINDILNLFTLPLTKAIVNS